MKKYKLIKSYPSIPHSMKVGNEVIWSKEMELYHHAKTLDTFRNVEIESFPEYWEEIKANDYEILKVFAGDLVFEKLEVEEGVPPLWIQKDDRYIYYFGLGEKYLGKEIEIHTIKRLSDGEIFTIGSAVVYGYRGVLKDIELTTDNKIRCGVIYYDLSHDYEKAPLEFLKKVSKEPVLLSLDGEQVYEGDVLYIATNSRFINTFVVTSNFKPSADLKYFYTYENAKKHDTETFENTKFSIKDIKRILKSRYTSVIDKSFKEDIINRK